MREQDEGGLAEVRELRQREAEEEERQWREGNSELAKAVEASLVASTELSMDGGAATVIEIEDDEQVQEEEAEQEEDEAEEELELRRAKPTESVQKRNGLGAAADPVVGHLIVQVLSSHVPPQYLRHV
jgi:hypothetical protein